MSFCTEKKLALESTNTIVVNTVLYYSYMRNYQCNNSAQILHLSHHFLSMKVCQESFCKSVKILKEKFQYSFGQFFYAIWLPISKTCPCVFDPNYLTLQAHRLIFVLAYKNSLLSSGLLK